MKRAKLILAGIACMAVVGGAYAVKANRFGKVIYTTTASTGKCNVTLPNYYTTNAAPGFAVYATTAFTTGTCRLTLITLNP